LQTLFALHVIVLFLNSEDSAQYIPHSFTLYCSSATSINLSCLNCSKIVGFQVFAADPTRSSNWVKLSLHRKTFVLEQFQYFICY